KLKPTAFCSSSHFCASRVGPQPAMTLKPSLCSRWQMAVPIPPMPPVTYASFCPMLTFLRVFIERIHATEASALDSKGNPHAPADAQRRQAALGVAALHFVQQGHEHAAAG